MKQFAPKLGMMAMSLALMTACQSTQTTQISNSNGLTANQAFELYNKSNDATAKSTLLTGLTAHLASNRVSVSEYFYQESPLASENSLDRGADPLFVTLLKLRDHQYDGDEEDKAYRRLSSYLDDSHELYLRYYDEQDDTSPSVDYALTPLDAMTVNTSHFDDEIKSLARAYQTCVSRTSYDIDEQVRQNSAFTNSDKKFKESDKILDDCIAKADKKHTPEDSLLTEYQRQDTVLLKSCVRSYQDNLFSALSAQRTQKRYENQEFDSYDSVYGHYAICMAGYEMGVRQDPNYYMTNELTEDRLKLYKGVRECAMATTSDNQKLAETGKTYATDPKAYEANFYQYFGCLDKVGASVFDKGETTHKADNIPTSMAQVQDMYGNFSQLSYDKLYAESEEMDEESGGVIAGAFDKYFKMKQAELDKAKNEQSPEQPNYASLGMMSAILSGLNKTPEQILAKNAYGYHNTKISVISEHKPAERLYQGVFEMAYDSPTASQSLSVPVRADFNHNRLTADVSGLLPLVALTGNESVPLPQDFKTAGASVGAVAFELPKEFDGIIPVAVIYDSLQRGILAGFGELSSTSFSQINAQNDPFVSQFGANQVIKLTLSTQETGKLLGIALKQLNKDLNAYVDENPQLFEEKGGSDDVAEDILLSKKSERLARLKSFIKKWTLLDKGFVGSDVGSVVQLVEAVSPVDFYNVNYYYLNNGKLVGQIVKGDNEELMTKSRTELLGITNFNANAFNAHPLKAKLTTLNGKTLDGNALIKSAIDVGKLKKEATELRYSYEENNEINNENDESAVEIGKK